MPPVEKAVRLALQGMTWCGRKSPDAQAFALTLRLVSAVHPLNSKSVPWRGMVQVRVTNSSQSRWKWTGAWCGNERIVWISELSNYHKAFAFVLFDRLVLEPMLPIKRIIRFIYVQNLSKTSEKNLIVLRNNPRMHLLKRTFGKHFWRWADIHFVPEWRSPIKCRDTVTGLVSVSRTRSSSSPSTRTAPVSITPSSSSSSPYYFSSSG